MTSHRSRKLPRVIHYNEAQAQQAFAAHAALLRCEAHDPALRDNPFWTVLKQDALERFGFAFMPGDTIK